MKLTKIHLRKIIKEEISRVIREVGAPAHSVTHKGYGDEPHIDDEEELQETTYPKHAQALLNGIILYFGVGPDEAKELLEEFEDAVYWKNKNR